MMTKARIIEHLQLKEFDYARPIEWDRKVKELGIDPNNYVWYYGNGSIMGEPLNVVEMYFEAFVNSPRHT